MSFGGSRVFLRSSIPWGTRQTLSQVMAIKLKFYHIHMKKTDWFPGEGSEEKSELLLKLGLSDKIKFRAERAYVRAEPPIQMITKKLFHGYQFWDCIKFIWGCTTTSILKLTAFYLTFWNYATPLLTPLSTPLWRTLVNVWITFVKTGIHWWKLGVVLFKGRSY